MKWRLGERALELVREVSMPNYIAVGVNTELETALNLIERLEPSPDLPA